MEPTGKIGPQPWMTQAETGAVIGALTAAGQDVRFVGGCVRDAIAGRVVKDVDIATPDRPEKVMALLEKAGIKVVPTGLKHGTVTAVINGKTFEITTLRVDVETDGRRAKVAFTEDWLEDAKRRDFTINTLSSTPDGDVYDPFGGMDDLAYGRVRFVGVARERLEEDLLRVLRFFRFYADYGRPDPDDEALAACRSVAHRLSELSAERIQSELFRILMTPEPAEVIGLMRGARIFETILPEADGPGRLRTLVWLETRAMALESIAPDPLRRLAAMLDTDGDGADAVADRLRLSNQQKIRLAAMIAPSARLAAQMDEPARVRALQGMGADSFRDVALLAWAGERAVNPRQPEEQIEGWLGQLKAAETWVRRQFPLKGRDVTARGVAAGKKIGVLLAQVEKWWEEGGFRADRDACLGRLDSLIEDR